MILTNGFSGLSGLGAYPPGPPDDPCKYDPDWYTCMQNVSAAQANNNQSTNIPWWQSLVTGVAQGAAAGIWGDDAAPTAPIPPVMPYVPPAPPWYTTPVGMGGIAAGALVLFLLLRK